MTPTGQLPTTPITVTFPIEGTTVLWCTNGVRVCAMHPQTARELGRALQRPKLCQPPAPFAFREDLGRLVILGDGRILADAPFDIAAKLGAILIGQAGLAEEIENATKVPVSFAEGAPSSIIADQALATRSGAPFGLTNHPKILDEAKKEAFENRDLRRYMPEMRGTAMIGAPTVRQFSPDPKQAAREKLASLSPDERLALARQALH